MKQILYSIAAAALIIAGFSACNSTKDISSAVATVDFKLACLDCDNGVQLMRAWGKGNNKNEAIQRARKNALEGVLFTGVTEGTGNCSARPLLPGANARENHRDFFNAFFSDKGPWAKFVKLDEKRGSRMASKNSTIENWEVTVSVDRQALADYLMENGYQVAL